MTSQSACHIEINVVFVMLNFLLRQMLEKLKIGLMLKSAPACRWTGLSKRDGFSYTPEDFAGFAFLVYQEFFILRWFTWGH